MWHSTACGRVPWRPQETADPSADFTLSSDDKILWLSSLASAHFKCCSKLPQKGVVLTVETLLSSSSFDWWAIPGDSPSEKTYSTQHPKAGHRKLLGLPTRFMGSLRNPGHQSPKQCPSHEASLSLNSGVGSTWDTKDSPISWESIHPQNKQNLPILHCMGHIIKPDINSDVRGCLIQFLCFKLTTMCS